MTASPRRTAAARALAMADLELLSDCEEEFFVSSGPGGQHRNKTASGVRLTHRPTELSVTATERRSQWLNRTAALQRLRLALRRLAIVPKVRHKTEPTRGAKQRRLDQKRKLGEKKAQRAKSRRSLGAD